MGTEKWVCREPDSCFVCPYSDCIKSEYACDYEPVKKPARRAPKEIPFPEGYKPPEAATYVVELEDGSIRKYHILEEAYQDVKDVCGLCLDSFRTYCLKGIAIKGIRSVTETAGWKLKGKKRKSVKATWEDGRSITIPGMKETAKVLGISWSSVYKHSASGKPISGVLLEQVEP